MIKQMEIRESKTEVNVSNVKPMEPQIVRIQVAFVCIGRDTTTVQIGLCQDDKFELEVNND